MRSPKISTIKGRGIVLKEDNIDTDRIMPARFLKCVVFDGLGEHVFEDDRKAMRLRGETHPFDDPRFEGASIFFVGRNFGCGSSREHAVHGLMRWGREKDHTGIKAIVSYGDFSEIFFTNALNNGIPCVMIAQDAWEAFAERIKEDPCAEIIFSLESMTISLANLSALCGFQKPNAHSAFLEGSWDTISLLLGADGKIEEIMNNLPYLHSL